MTPPPMGKPTIMIAQVRRAVWVKLAITFPTPAIAIPSFDVISEVDKHELTNAVDQANRELSTCFDSKGQDASSALDAFVINQSAPSEFKLHPMLDKLGREQSRDRVCPYV